MARSFGSKNKRTLLREARIREATEQASMGIKKSTDPQFMIDSLALMEAGMRYFYGRHLAAVKKGGKASSTADAALLDAIRIAEKIAPYRHPRLSTVRVATDPNQHSEDMTADEIRDDILAGLEEMGIKAEITPLGIKSRNTKPN
jgi:hypothetical protein